MPNDFDPRDPEGGDAGQAVDPVEPELIAPLQPHQDAASHVDGARDASVNDDSAVEVDAGTDAHDASASAHDATASDASASDASAPAEDASAPSVSFASVYGVLMSNCVGCHGANKPLDLSTPELAHAQLVGVAASYPACSGDAGSYTRVVAGDPAQSLLLAKLEGTQTCGKQMPPKALLGEADIALFRSWIEAGAPAN